METISKIRRLYHKDKLSIRAISFKLNLNRRTVAKYLNSTEAPAYKRTADKKHYPRLGEYLAELNQRLYHEQSQPKSQHMTARRHYEWLKSKGYEGRYEAVNTYIRQFKQAQPHSPEVFIPQHYPIGDAYQFDWSTETVKIGGHIVKAQVAHFRLCHSRCFFVCAYPNQKMEMLIDAHNSGALRNGEPFLHWPLPKPIKQIQTHLLKQPKGDKAMVKLLTLIAEYGEELGVMAAEIALEEGMPTVAAVLNIIHRLTEPVIPKIETYDVPLRLPPLAHLSRYDTLLKQGVTHEAR